MTKTETNDPQGESDSLEEKVVVANLEIDELDGIGPATKAKLNDIGIITVLDLAVKSPSDVADAVGSDLARATELCNKARTKLS